MGIVKESEWKECGHCGSRKRVADEVRGCDVCKRVFDDDGPMLSADIFNKGDAGGSRVSCIDACSWTCALKALAKVECDYFVSLPYLHYDDDETPEGARAQDFFEAIKQFAAEVNTR